MPHPELTIEVVETPPIVVAPPKAGDIENQIFEAVLRASPQLPSELQTWFDRSTKPILPTYVGTPLSELDRNQRLRSELAELLPELSAEPSYDTRVLGVQIGLVQGLIEGEASRAKASSLTGNRFDYDISRTYQDLWIPRRDHFPESVAEHRLYTKVDQRGAASLAWRLSADFSGSPYGYTFYAAVQEGLI